MKGGVKMEKRQLWTIIAVSLVVAVVASIVTASITGNVVKVHENKKGPAVYTIAEVDAKFGSLLINGTTITTRQKPLGQPTIYLNSYTAAIDGILRVTENVVSNKKVIADSVEVNSASIKQLSVNGVSIDGTGIYGQIGKDIVIAPGNNLLVTSSKVRMSSLSGQGNAYACVDSNGTIFRSLSACK